MVVARWRRRCAPQVACPPSTRCDKGVSVARWLLLEGGWLMDLMMEDTAGTEEQIVADAVGSSSQAGSQEACCADCAARDAAQAEEFVYVLGKVDVRFP